MTVGFVPDRVQLARVAQGDPQDPLLGPVELEARKLVVHVAEPNVLVERDGRVGIVLMNRPKALNALSGDLMEAVVAALGELDADPEIRAIVHGGVARVVAKEAWLDEAKRAAREIAEKGPIAVRLAKEAVDQAFETPLAAGVELERRSFFLARASEDAGEGLKAFLEKRKPDFTGR